MSAARLRTSQLRPVWGERRDLMGTCAGRCLITVVSVPSRHASRFEKKDISMPDSQPSVIAGIDCRTDFHVAAALDPLGRVLGAESAGLERRLDRLVAVAAPATLSRLGCGTHHTAALLVAAGENIGRLGSEASFAHLCGTAPVTASSGRTSRHRLNFAGNRDANRALHMIVIVRLRYCERTRSYPNRRLAEGKTKKEAIRCLKRFAAREPYRTLRADLATPTTRT